MRLCVEPHAFTAVASMRASTFAKASAFAEAPAYAEATAGMSADKSCEGG